MFDAAIRRAIDPMLNRGGAALARAGLGANAVTLAGLCLGLAAAITISVGAAGWALLPLLLSRLADGLDGAVARATEPTDFGGYLDIFCDFVFYGVVPAGFVWASPAENGAAGAFLLAGICANGASFLGFSILAEKHRMTTEARGVKSLYFSGGLLEGSETIAFFIALCLWPGWFAPLSWIFGSLCFVTAVVRVVFAYRQFPPAG